MTPPKLTGPKLTGSDLLAKVSELKSLPRREVAIACGYVASDGRVRWLSFLNALTYAKKALKTPTEPEKSYPLSWRFKLQNSPHAFQFSRGYARLIGAKPGDIIEIKHVGNSLVLRLAKD